MKKIFMLALCLRSLSVSAQNVWRVIDAEKSFAAYARETDTRSAFLKFMDTSAVVFNSGQIQNAITVWTKTPPSTDKLLWTPAFAGIAASDDLGFTTGPWQYKKTLTDSALASGVFTSVWRKNAHGEWKNIVDMGYGFAKPAYIEPQIKLSMPLSGAKQKLRIDPITLDQDLITRYTATGPIAFKYVMADDCWSNINGIQPYVSAQQFTRAITTMPADLKMTPVGSGISTSGDLAYVYGIVTNAKGKENYLRVWKQTNNGWKIILQVLQWRI